MCMLNNDNTKIYDGYVIPLSESGLAIDATLLNHEVCTLSTQIINASNVIINEQPQCFTIMTVRGIVKVVFFIAKKQSDIRALFIQTAAALRMLKGQNIEEISLLLGNAENSYHSGAIMQKMFELPALVFYNFDAYLGKKETVHAKVSFALSALQKSENVEEYANLSKIVADGTLLARELVNRPGDYMTPEKLAQCALEAGQRAGFVTEILDQRQIEEIGMKSFLSVSAGSYNPPRLIIMRYNGAPKGAPLVAIVGKGITFDSGGYSLKGKSGMTTMHTDMGGGAAVIGAMYAAAKQGAKINLIGIVPACANLIGPHATLPGSVIGSLLGRTIEVVSTDGEGRLVLCDALTYAAKHENADILIDIATLTGGSSTAVGTKSAVVITEDEELYAICAKASQKSCEKTWRLDMDEELRPILKSFYADSKNSPSGPKHGGTIVAALFLKQFTLGKRWLHIDMAPVAWVTNDELPYAPKGATGYGVSLLNAILQQIGE